MANKRQRDAKRGGGDPSCDVERRLKEYRTGMKSYLTLPKDVSMFNPQKDDPYNLDFLSTWAGKKNPYRNKGEATAELTFYAHMAVLPNNGSHLCLRLMWNEKCPTCERQQVMLNEDPVGNKELAKKLAPKTRQLFLVRDLGDQPKTNRVWDVSGFCFGDHLQEKIAKAEKDDRKSWARFADMEKGMTVRVVPTKKPIESNHFLDFVDITFKPRTKQYKYGLMDDLPCLEDLLEKPSYEELKEILDGGDLEAVDKKKGGKKKPADEEEESSSDSDESSSSDDDSSSSEEEPKPAKKPAGKKPGKKPAAKPADDESSSGDDSSSSDESSSDESSSDDDDSDSGSSSSSSDDSSSEESSEDDSSSSDESSSEEKPKPGKKPGKKPAGKKPPKK